MALISVVKDAKNRLTKHFTLDEQGKLVKRVGEHVIDAVIRTVDVTASQLALEIIPNLTQNECLVLGQLEDYSNPQPLKCNANAGPGEATRTKAYLDFRTLNNFLLLDFDDTNLSPEQALAMLTKVDPQFDSCSCAVVPSSSSHVYNGDELVSGSRNFHIYVEMQGNPAEYGQKLFNRLVLMGEGFPHVTKAGTIVVKTIFDKSVLSPEREIFAADPVMDLPLRTTRLEHVEIQEGTPVQDRGQLDLSAEDEIRLRQTLKNIRDAAEPDAKEARAAYNETRASHRSKINGTNRLHELAAINDADVIYDKLGRPIVELKSGEWIYNEAGELFQVHDLLLDPQEGMKLPDPMEPFIRGDEARGIPGKGVATVLGNMIYSHSHAGILYIMRWDYADLEEVLRAADNETKTYIWKAISSGAQEISTTTDEAQISELADVIKSTLQVINGAGAGKEKKHIVAKLKPPKPPEDAEDGVILKLNATHAVVKAGGKSVIVTENWNESGELFEVEYSSPYDLDLYYKNEHVKVTGIPGVQGGKMNAYRYWEQHRDRNTFEGICFVPNSTTHRKPEEPRVIQQEGRSFNMFQGYILDPDKSGPFDLILQHLKEIWCSGIEVEYEYLMGWLAHLMQNPEKVSTTALVLQSMQGTGKGIIIDKIFVKTFGQHAISTANQDDLVGRFNSHLGMNLFFYGNELAYTAQNSVKSLIKTILTDEHRMIEAKNVNKIRAKNYTSAMFSSNETWLLNIDVDDRRMVYLSVSDDKAGDRPYFQKLLHQIENGGRESFIRYLLEYDYSGVDLKKIPNPNQRQRRMDFLRSAHPIVKFFYSLIDTDMGTHIYASHALGKRLKEWQEGKTGEMIIDKAQMFDVFTVYASYFQIDRKHIDISSLISNLEAGGLMPKDPAADPIDYMITTKVKDGKNVLAVKSIAECKRIDKKGV